MTALPRLAAFGLILLSLAATDLQAQNLFSKQMTLLVDGNARTHYYESNQDINIAGNTIERLIVAVHGSSRTNITYQRLVDAALANGVDSTTIIYAPQFVIDDDVAANALGSEVLFWPGGWRQGHLSTDNGFGRISSFALVNQVVTGIVANNPSIADVVFVGHSAGGQYSQRFAAASRLEQDLNGIVNGIRVRYVPANPSSTVYMDEKRRTGNTVDQFEVPDSANCPDYDTYKYGLAGGFNNFVNSNGGAAQLRAQYPGRDVRYLLGANDNDPGSSSLDTSCEGNFQGAHRLERGVIFYNHIRDHFGPSVHDTHLLAISPDIGHSSRIYTRQCGISWLFDIGSCPFVAPTHLQVSVDNATGDASLAWQDRASAEDSYSVERSSDGGSSFTVLASVAADTSDYLDNTAMPSTEYRYRVRAQSGAGSSAYSNVVIANAGATPPANPPSPTPTPPPVPGNNGSGGGNIGLTTLLLLSALVLCVLVLRARLYPEECID